MSFSSSSPPQHDIRLVRLVGEITVEATAVNASGCSDTTHRPQLFLDEPVVWFVRIERLNHIIAICHAFGRVVRFEAFEWHTAPRRPVPRPALAILRRGEQFVRDALERFRRIVGENACTWSGDGGMPVITRYARRISVALSAGGFGFTPRSSSFARIE
jgi:hypothetical protein